MNDGWKPQQMEIKYCWIGNGIYVATCFSINSDVHLGTVWARLGSDSYRRVVCDIIEVYVPQRVRRHGVATFILKQLLNDYGILRTQTFSKDGRFIQRSMGWRKNSKTGDWYLYGKVRRMAK